MHRWHKNDILHSATICREEYKLMYYTVLYCVGQRVKRETSDVNNTDYQIVLVAVK
jgi:hypothetical protein